LGHKFYIYAIYVLNETSDRREDLLRDVPIYVQIVFASGGQYLVRVEGLVSQLWILFVSLEWLFADHIGHEIVDQF
jgi:hypothetical protein